MPRYILGNESNQNLRLRADATESTRTSGGSRVSLRRRSGTYLQLLRRLDTTGAVRSAELADIHAAIDAEFPMPNDARPQGLIGRCHLGHPFEVHTLDLAIEIIDHYPTGKALPGMLEAHRTLAQSPHYLAIEVYPDRIVCIRSDGTTIERRND